ncbi:MAG TPA: M1 family metallopeptidase [Burkholderiales bacterium]|jgi:aminopeptidase N|nr:M1 family metallopeptidase [Burkholderiales bacterium]
MRILSRWPLAFALAALLFLPVGSALAEARFSFAATPGKLPKDVVPSHYRLRIVPEAGNERFAGHAEIEIEVKKPVDSIVLNASGLLFEAGILASGAASRALKAKPDFVSETVTLAPEKGMIAAGVYRLAIDYTGSISRYPQGFYRIDYKLNEGGRLVDKVMLATQMEPVHARKLFPGWDEPAFRATFEVSAIVGAGQTVVSNMPVASESPRGKGLKEVFFERSVSMPTYLVALFIGEMDAVRDSVDGIPLAFYTARGRGNQARFALEATKQIVRYFNEYFDVRYALPKLDQIALPGGIGGAMENWGAIAYNESRMLVAPTDNTLRQRQSAYAIVAHEVAHQWFGNLVTMAWWDNLWLNEGFAQWMQGKTAERFHPEWHMRLRSGLFRQSAMSEDARRITHPIQTPVASDARAMDVFDAITYSKGESFIGMLEDYLGEDAFRDGIRRYLRAHAFSNTTTADLWHHLSAASGRDVAKLAAGWTEQPGFPLVHVSRRCEGGMSRVALAQERFTMNYPEAPRLQWNVPVSLIDAAGALHRAFLEGSSTEIGAGPCGRVLANSSGVGYYRVQYDVRSFDDIAASLEKLPVPDRFRVLTDSFALVQAGRLDAGRYLGLVDRLGEERDPTVWDHVLGTLRFLRDLLDEGESQAAFDLKVIQLLRGPFQRIGWDPSPGEPQEVAPLRRALVDALGRAGDPAVIGEARKRFAARAQRPLDALMRPTVLSIVGRYADAATFDALLDDWRRADGTEVRYQYQSALRHASDPALARRWMELALGSSEMPPADAVFNVHRTGADSGQRQLAWDFVRANLAALYAKTSPRGRVYVLPDAASAFADEKVAEELLSLTREKLGPGAYYQAEKMADWIRLKASVKARETGRIARWAGAQ